MILVQKFHILQAILRSHNMCFGDANHTHVTFVFMFVMNFSLHELTTTALCQIDQMKAHSFLLYSLSHTFPHFSLSHKVRLPCHLMIIDLGGKCFD